MYTIENHLQVLHPQEYDQYRSGALPPLGSPRRQDLWHTGGTTSRTLFLLCALLSNTMRRRDMVFSQGAQCTISPILGSSCVFSVPLYCFLEVWFGAILCSSQPALCFVNCVLLCCSAADGLYLARSCGAPSQRAPAPCALCCAQSRILQSTSGAEAENIEN